MKARNNDLCLLKSLSEYKTINKEISLATTGKTIRHLCYLSEELVGLAFFNDDAMPNVKQEIVKAMLAIEE